VGGGSISGGPALDNFCSVGKKTFSIFVIPSPVLQLLTPARSAHKGENTRRINIIKFFIYLFRRDVH
jgi:hypothetical protein